MKSWKTTVGGILVAAGQFLTPVLPPHLAWVAAAVAGVGGLFLTAARDNKVSSEEAGAK